MEQTIEVFRLTDVQEFYLRTVNDTNKKVLFPVKWLGTRAIFT